MAILGVGGGDPQAGGGGSAGGRATFFFGEPDSKKEVDDGRAGDVGSRVERRDCETYTLTGLRTGDVGGGERREGEEVGFYHEGRRSHHATWRRLSGRSRRRSWSRARTCPATRRTGTRRTCKQTGRD